MPKDASLVAGSRPAVPLFRDYRPASGGYDEFVQPNGRGRPAVAGIMRRLDQLGRDEFRQRQKLADVMFMESGVTFSVYSDQRGAERIFPFDMIPRVLAGSEWAPLERGLKQRVAALNAFLTDVYGKQRILHDGVVPRALVEGSPAYLKQLRGIQPPGGVYVHIAGIDLVRDAQGRFLVLEDNVRVPSGVSYVLENRMVMKKALPRIFGRSRVMPVEDYPLRLRRALAAVAPRPARRAHVVVLTPGRYNSAYFEHSFLARRMGCELVEGQDLFVEDDRVFARTTRGPTQVDVIYRRVDDAFLDPQVFRKDSLLGVPGLVRAYAKGNVALANALGNGVVDDKAVYPYVPDMVRYYLDEAPLIEQVPTYICDRKEDLQYVLDNVPRLVIKAVNEAGGYGMLVGPKATRAECAAFRDRVRARPRNYIAQPLVELSSCPVWTRQGVAPRRVDLRPYVVTGTQSWVLPGGLTRVALKRGSYVVNSSQGGGSKDTWVLEQPS